MLHHRGSKLIQTSFCSCGKCGRVFLVLPTSNATTRADMIKQVGCEVDPLCDCWLWHGLSLEWVVGQWPKQVVR